MSDVKKESRINIEDLPHEEKELSADEQKQVQGGATRAVTPGIRTGGTNAVAGDGSVMPISSIMGDDDLVP
jgi:hypothetical protein